MILSSDKILEELQEIWPDFEWEFPKNPYYTAMPDDMLQRVIKECSVSHMKYIPGIWECENYSGKFQTNVETFLYELHESGEYQPEHRWYIQDSFGKDYSNPLGDGNHSQNLIRLESGWVIFKPQTNEVSRDFKSFELIVGEA